MKYLLDTNVCVRYLNERVPQVRVRLLALDEADIAVSIITKAEVYTGQRKVKRPNARMNDRSRSYVGSDCCPSMMRRSSSMLSPRVALEQTGRLNQPSRYANCSIALANDLVLVTHNTAEFSRIEHLILEDWEMKAADEDDQ